MQKHVGLGLRNRYRVDVFQGKNLAKKNRTNSYQEKYDKKYLSFINLMNLMVQEKRLQIVGNLYFHLLGQGMDYSFTIGIILLWL